MNEIIIGGTGCHFVGSLAGPHAEDCPNHEGEKRETEIRKYLNLLRFKHGDHVLLKFLKCAHESNLPLFTGDKN